MPTADDQFWAQITSKRDEGLAHLTDMIQRSGIDEICAFLVKHVMPQAVDDFVTDQETLTKHIIAHMALVGAVDALLAWRDAHPEEVSP